MFPQPGEKDNLPEQTRKVIFHELVQAQDGQMGVAQSRQMISSRFGLSEGQIRGIEREGLDSQWPPL